MLKWIYLITIFLPFNCQGQDISSQNFFYCPGSWGLYLRASIPKAPLSNSLFLVSFIRKVKILTVKGSIKFKRNLGIFDNMIGFQWYWKFHTKLWSKWFHWRESSWRQHNSSSQLTNLWKHLQNKKIHIYCNISLQLSNKLFVYRKKKTIQNIYKINFFFFHGSLDSFRLDKIITLYLLPFLYFQIDWLIHAFRNQYRANLKSIW